MMIDKTDNTRAQVIDKIKGTKLRELTTQELNHILEVIEYGSCRINTQPPR